MTDCMCRGCYAGCGASLHYIPKDPETRQKWIDFIYKNRTAPKFKNLDRIRICSAHFTEECFTNYRQKMMGFGKRLILKPNAVPTIAVQQEFIAPSRTGQEKLEETMAETRLCPLCQRCQKDNDTLSLHLTKKHSVHPACLDNLLVTAPYANSSSGTVRESTAQNFSKFTQQTSSENTNSPLMADQQNSSLQQNDACDESGGSYDDTQASVKDDKSRDKSNAAPDGNANLPFKCHTCLEFFSHKSALSEHYNSATHIQKMRTGAGNESDCSTPVLAYPYASTKPYQCDVCHVSYFYAFGLESHLKSVLHQSRTRKAGNTATNSKSNTNSGFVMANLVGSTVVNATQLASAKTYNCAPKAEQVQLQPASSSLRTPVVSAQAMPTVLPLITLAPNAVPHAIAPPVFPSSTTQLIPQPQMLMPVILNGLQNQSATPDGPQQLLQQAVPVLCSAQQPHGPASSDSQSQMAATEFSIASPTPLGRNPTVDAAGVKVKTEIKEEPCDQEVSRATPCTADAICQVGLKQECNSMWDWPEYSLLCGDKQPSESKVVSVGEHPRQRSDSNKASRNQDLQSVGKPSRSKCNPSHASLVLNSQPCSSLPSGPGVLTEFQSQVLWAFLESRNEADSEIPPSEDCEALGREVGLTEDEVRKWLVETHPGSEIRLRTDARSHHERQGSTEDEDDEGALMIDESGGTVLRSTTDFLSDEEDVDVKQTTVDKKRKRGMGKEDLEEESQFPPSSRTSRPSS